MATMKVLGESGIFAKIGKRNLVLICAVLFIGLAVYLNYMWFSDAAEPTGNIGYGENNNLAGGTAEPEDENVSGTTTPDTDSYFTSAQLSRQQARDEALQVLQTVLANAQALDETKEQALADISAIAGEIEHESNVEALVVAKGFEDCVAVINGEKASVGVKVLG